jgi:hypothetical protein
LSQGLPFSRCKCRRRRWPMRPDLLRQSRDPRPSVGYTRRAAQRLRARDAENPCWSAHGTPGDQARRYGYARRLPGGRAVSDRGSRCVRRRARGLLGAAQAPAARHWQWVSCSCSISIRHTIARSGSCSDARRPCQSSR